PLQLRVALTSPKPSLPSLARTRTSRNVDDACVDFAPRTASAGLNARVTAVVSIASIFGTATPAARVSITPASSRRLGRTAAGTAAPGRRAGRAGSRPTQPT